MQRRVELSSVLGSNPAGFLYPGSRDGARNEYGAFATNPSAEEFEGL